MNFIYISHHFTAREDMNSTNWPRSQCVALQLGWPGASHRYRGGHELESCWSPDIFQGSSFQLLKLENLVRWSLFTFIYNRSTRWISYIFHMLLFTWIKRPPHLHQLYVKREVCVLVLCKPVPFATGYIAHFTAMISVIMSNSKTWRFNQKSMKW